MKLTTLWRSSSASQACAALGAALFCALDHDAFVDLCHVLLNSNEFLYVD